MRLQKLLHMGPAEIAGRSWQQALKALDLALENGGPPNVFAALAADGVLDPVREMIRSGDRSGAARRLLQGFDTAAPGRFFAGAAETETVARIRASAPAAVQAILDSAKAVCRRRFDVLGYQRLFFGDPVDWHLDPISGCRSPRVHWSRIDALDTRMCGDSKVVWELNRHQWLLDLGQAYRITGDRRYAAVCVLLLREWMEANPPGTGINWASSLEVALRLICWCWAAFLFRGSGALGPDLYVDMLAWIRSHALHVERYLSHYFSPNTHLTGEALGLFYAGVAFPELRGADRWRALGMRILLDQMERQCHADGVYFEQSTRYQHYTVEIYLHFLILAARNGIPVPAQVALRVQALLDFLIAVRSPDGSMPQIGDADGGWLLPLQRRKPGDFRGVFAVAAALFGRADYAWAAGGSSVEVEWLLGRQGVDAFHALSPVPPAGPASRMYPQGGYAVLRDGWAADSNQLILDAGPLGCPISSGHGHADLLSIQCAAFGRPCIVDPGTYCYTQDRTWRDYFRSTAAHSTVRVDGLDQAEPAGPFKWQSRSAARIRVWESTPDFDLVDAEHDAYSRLADPVTHRRRVLFAKRRYWIVVDDLRGAARHGVELCWQFDAAVHVAADNDSRVLALVDAGHGLLVRTFASVPMQMLISEGTVEPMRGWYSADYGQRTPAPQLRFAAAVNLPLRIVTVLAPVAGPVAAMPEVEALRDPGTGQVTGLHFEPTGETIGIQEEHISVEHRAHRTALPMPRRENNVVHLNRPLGSR